MVSMETLFICQKHVSNNFLTASIALLQDEFEKFHHHNFELQEFYNFGMHFYHRDLSIFAAISTK